MVRFASWRDERQKFDPRDELAAWLRRCNEQSIVLPHDLVFAVRDYLVSDADSKTVLPWEREAKAVTKDF